MSAQTIESIGEYVRDEEKLPGTPIQEQYDETNGVPSGTVSDFGTLDQRMLTAGLE
jgi:hypothetical protein